MLFVAERVLFASEKVRIVTETVLFVIEMVRTISARAVFVTDKAVSSGERRERSAKQFVLIIKKSFTQPTDNSIFSCNFYHTNQLTFLIWEKTKNLDLI